MKVPSVFIIVIIAISLGYFIYIQPSDALTKSNDALKKSIVTKQETTNASLLPAAKAVNENLQQLNTSIPPVERPKQKNETSKLNSVKQFDKLPKEMQEEIKRLSGRDNRNVQPIEVEPGVFIIPPDQSIRVVPVAVMNEDGTVSIHEY